MCGRYWSPLSNHISLGTLRWMQIIVRYLKSEERKLHTLYSVHLLNLPVLPSLRTVSAFFLSGFWFEMQIMHLLIILICIKCECEDQAFKCFLICTILAAMLYHLGQVHCVQSTSLFLVCVLETIKLQCFESKKNWCISLFAVHNLASKFDTRIDDESLKMRQECQIWWFQISFRSRQTMIRCIMRFNERMRINEFRLKVRWPRARLNLISLLFRF